MCVFTCFEFVCVFSVLPDLIVFYSVKNSSANYCVLNDGNWMEVVPEVMSKLLVQYSADRLCVCVCKSFSCHFFSLYIPIFIVINYSRERWWIDLLQWILCIVASKLWLKSVCVV